MIYIIYGIYIRKNTVRCISFTYKQIVKKVIYGSILEPPLFSDIKVYLSVLLNRSLLIHTVSHRDAKPLI